MRSSSAQRELLRRVPALRMGLGSGVAAGALATVALVLQTLLLSWIVRDVLFSHARLRSMLPLILITVAVIAARSLCVFLREFACRRTAVRVKATLRQSLVQHLFRLGPAYLSGTSTAVLVAAAHEGIERLDAYAGRYLPQVALAVVTPFLLLAAIAWVDPLSAALLVFTVPIVVLLMVLIGTFTETHVQREWATLGHLSTALLDAIQGLPTILLLDQQDRERSRVQSLSLRFRDHTLSVLRVAFLSGAVLELMTAAGIGLVATVLGVRLLNGGIPFDRALYVFLLTPEFYRPLRELGVQRHAALEGAAAAAELREILDTVPATRAAENPHDTHVAVAESGITLTGVSVTHAGRETPALVIDSLQFPRGTSTAIVGRSGAGKSTLLNLLLRTLEPGSGAVAVDGVPLSRYSAAEWRRQIAFVPQRPHLFAATVRDNIRLAVPDAPDEEVLRAARRAGCEDFIGALPLGLDTVLGEGGAGLSAGERQRLAIARAFLKDAPILLLDEPTSALDPVSEAQIRGALQSLMQGRTTVVVAHRLQTIAAADRVVVLDRGRVQDVGGHAKLRWRSAGYRELLGTVNVEAVPA